MTGSKATPGPVLMLDELGLWINPPTTGTVTFRKVKAKHGDVVEVDDGRGDPRHLNPDRTVRRRGWVPWRDLPSRVEYPAPFREPVLLPIPVSALLAAHQQATVDAYRWNFLAAGGPIPDGTRPWPDGPEFWFPPCPSTRRPPRQRAAGT